MWRTFIFDNKPYILKVEYVSDYKFTLTDFENSILWEENLTKQQIYERCKELNPLIETTCETYIETITTSLDNSNDETKYNLKNGVDELVLEINSEIHSMKFTFQIVFHIAESKTFYDQIIIPFIRTIQYMKKKEDGLCEIIQKKDEEIARHVYENGEIEKKQLVTEKFNKSDFMPVPKHLCCDLFTDNFFNDKTDPIKKEEVEVVRKKHKSVSVGQKFMMKKKKKC